MEYLSKILVNFFENKIGVSAQDIDDERKLIDLEDVYKDDAYFHSTYYLGVLDYSYMEKLYGPRNLLQTRFPAKEYDLEQIHKDIITENRVSVIIRGDRENPDIVKTITLLESWLSKREIKKRKYINNGMTYYPQVDEFEMTGQVRPVGIFFSQTKLGYEQFAYYIFFYHFILINLNEYVREVEISNYGVNHTYRMVPYAWQKFFKFQTKLGSEEVIGLFEQFFHKTKEDFEWIKQRFVKDIQIWSDTIGEYYYVAQSHLFLEGEGYKPLYDIEEYILKMSFDDFQKFYFNDGMGTLSVLDMSDYDEEKNKKD